MSTLNLNEARAKRAEANKGATAPELEVGDDVFVFPTTMEDVPFEAIDLIDRDDVKAGLIMLFGTERWERFCELAGPPTVGDITDIVTWLMGEYEAGESSASAAS